MKRRLHIDYQKLEGAKTHKRVLHLLPEEGIQQDTYVCPVVTCLHDPYKSVRGLRKHINSIHPWYFYFDEPPRIQRKEAVHLPQKKFKASTHSMPSFSITTGIGQEFLQWLMTPCGGGKSNSEGQQQARRAMKFLSYSLGDASTDDIVTTDAIDCCLGTPSVIINFMQTITEDWDLSDSGSLNYLKAVGDLLDYRKSQGVTDNVLRTFAVSEVYIRRGIGNLGRKKRVNYNRNLDLEQLIARNSWASLEEMETVIPFHTPKFQDVVRSIRSEDCIPLSDIVFGTRYIITFLFLRVKCTRPMSYKYLTLSHLDLAKTNGGYVDQSTFKTSSTYAFDTLILSKDVLSILDTYVQVIRPKTNPSCEYILVNSNGKQHNSLGTEMALMTFSAIGKTVHPTRYRMIVETESADKLNPEERDMLSKDQRHSSLVAKRVYQKRLSRDVAQDGLSCIRKLVGTHREEHNTSIAEGLIELDTDNEEELTNSSTASPTAEGGSTSPINLLEENDEIACENGPSRDDSSLVTSSSLLDPLITSMQSSVTISQCSAVDSLSPVNVCVNPIPATTITCGKAMTSSEDLDLEMKKEEAEQQVADGPEAEQQVADGPKLLRFTGDEDEFLRKGTKKYGLSQWSKILKDPEYTFHMSRTRDSLRVRAETLGITQRRRRAAARGRSSRL